MPIRSAACSAVSLRYRLLAAHLVRDDGRGSSCPGRAVRSTAGDRAARGAVGRLRRSPGADGGAPGRRTRRAPRPGWCELLLIVAGAVGATMRSSTTATALTAGVLGAVLGDDVLMLMITRGGQQPIDAALASAFLFHHTSSDTASSRNSSASNGGPAGLGPRAAGTNGPTFLRRLAIILSARQA